MLNEIIVVDNGSTDGTVEIARELGVRILQIPKVTIAGLRNCGARAAHGRILAFVDADCTVAKGWLERIQERFQDPDVVATGSYPMVPIDHANWLQRTWALVTEPVSSSPHEVHWLPSANLVVRADAFFQVSGFDSELVSCEDADLCYRLKAIGKIIYDPEIRAVHYREPKTLRMFFTKEIWHGHGSFETIRNRRVVSAEIPSLMAAAVSLIGYLVTLLGLASVWVIAIWVPFFAGIFIVAAVPLAYSLRAKARKGRMISFPRIFVVYSVYFAARAVSLCLWLERSSRRLARESLRKAT